MICERRERESADEVPARDVQSVDTQAEGRPRGTAPHAHATARITAASTTRRKLRPLERLQDAGRNEGPSGEHDAEVPEEKKEPSEAAARDRQADKARRSRSSANASAALPRKPKKTPCVWFMRSRPQDSAACSPRNSGSENFDRHEQPEDRGDDEPRERRQRVSADQAVLDRARPVGGFQLALPWVLSALIDEPPFAGARVVWPSRIGRRHEAAVGRRFRPDEARVARPAAADGRQRAKEARDVGGVLDRS